MTDQPRRQRTVDCTLCGLPIVIAPHSHLKLAEGQRVHLDCVAISYLYGHVRPGINLKRICGRVGCDQPKCSRWTHCTVAFERPEPGDVEHLPPFALAVDEQPDCEICGRPLDDQKPPYTPNYDGRFVHFGCVIGDAIFGRPGPRPVR